MRILIRLNISKQLGTGHFRRMLNLSKHMSNHAFLFIIHTDDRENDLFKNKNVHFIENENDFFKILENYQYDVVIFDFLKYQQNFIKNIKNYTNKPIVSFHEYDDHDSYSDLIVNPNFCKFRNKSSCKNYLFGPEYIIFSDEIEKYKNMPKEEHIFISFGGADPSNLTQKFLKEVALKRKGMKFKIHIGNFNEVEMIGSKNIDYLVNPKEIFYYMSTAKMAVTAGGNMMYELIYFNTPCTVIAHNDHQEEFAKNAQNLGCVAYIGKALEYDSDKLIETIKFLYTKKSNEQSRIDNNGKKKIAIAIEKLMP